MNTQDQALLLLGYVKANIEWLCRSVTREDREGLFELLSELECTLNQEIQKILS